eukprot:Lankesteria_metandrocarpae@DN1718_c0_g1_i2.p1
MAPASGRRWRSRRYAFEGGGSSCQGVTDKIRNFICGERQQLWKHDLPSSLVCNSAEGEPLDAGSKVEVVMPRTETERKVRLAFLRRVLLIKRRTKQILLVAARTLDAKKVTLYGERLAVSLRNASPPGAVLAQRKAMIEHRTNVQLVASARSASGRRICDVSSKVAARRLEALACLYEELSLGEAHRVNEVASCRDLLLQRLLAAEEDVEDEDEANTASLPHQRPADTTGSITVCTTTGKVNTATGTVNTATGRVNTATGTVNTATGRVNTATGTVNTATGRVNTATGT